MVEPMFHKEKIMTIGNILREIRKSVNKKSQMSLRDMLVLAQQEGCKQNCVGIKCLSDPSESLVCTWGHLADT